MSGLRWMVGRDGSILDAVARVQTVDHERLSREVVNDALNSLIASDGGGLWEDGGPIPYAGWYWRYVDFFGSVTIASTEIGTAICENNKWDYDERDLTDAERQTFRDFVWAAYQEDGKGGNLAEIRANTRAKLDAAGAFVTSLTVGAS